eukprot:78341-Prymnesium_polylepis.1
MAVICLNDHPLPAVRGGTHAPRARGDGIRFAGLRSVLRSVACGAHALALAPAAPAVPSPTPWFSVDLALSGDQPITGTGTFSMRLVVRGYAIFCIVILIILKLASSPQKHGPGRRTIELEAHRRERTRRFCTRFVCPRAAAPHTNLRLFTDCCRSYVRLSTVSLCGGVARPRAGVACDGPVRALA